MQTFILIVIFTVSLYMTYLAAGTLNPTKLNMPMATMYLFYLQQGIGAILISSGFLGHYLYDYLNHKSVYTNATIAVIALVAILLPLSMYLISILFKLNTKNVYSEYIGAETYYAGQDTYSFLIVVVAGVISLGLLIILLIRIGYIPLVKLVIGGVNYATERIRINSINVIHPLIKNIGILTAMPVLSYVTFAYALVSKKGKWWTLFIVFFIASIVTKTYNFEKSPIVFHLAIFLFIYIYFNGGIKFKRIIWFALIGAVIILAMYFITFQGNIQVDLYNGPFSRVVFTPVGVIAMNLDLFPKYVSFLSGRSLPNTLLWIVGFERTEMIRSSRILMEYYGSESVYEGTAGVFNTLFVGESYANWGYLGMFLSIIWVAFVIISLFALMLKAKKTPTNIALNAYLTMSIATTSQGGFVDFLFNGSWVIVFILLGVLHYVSIKETDKALEFGGVA